MNRELLEKPFAADQIKQRKGGFGEVLDYIEGPVVIQRLNEAFQSEWSFRIQEHTILENEVVVLGELTAQGITKTQFGSKDITRAKADGATVSIGDDLKAAATDALKKCSTLFGVGLHLYFETPAAETTVAPAAAIAKPNGNGNGDGRITAPQLSAIFGIAGKKGWSHTQTREFAKNMFGKLPDFLTKREASAMIDHLQREAQGLASPKPQTKEGSHGN
jgi:Rad52/22 family double-strand break repair protein